MVNISSKCKPFSYIGDVYAEQTLSLSQRDVAWRQSYHPLIQLLHDFRIHARLFMETNKWDPIVTLKVGDAQHLFRMDDIESRWRNSKG